MADADFRRAVDTKVHWGTPTRELALVKKVAPIDLDPCSNTAAQKRVNAKTAWFGPPKCGLSQQWRPQIVSKNGIAFVNYPYGDARWLAKMAIESVMGTTIIGLMPASTETNWWTRLVVPYAKAICFIHGRLDFIDCTIEDDFNDCPYQLDFFGDPIPLIDKDDKKTGSTFGSAMVFMSKRRSPNRFIDVFQLIGDIWVPGAR